MYHEMFLMLLLPLEETIGICFFPFISWKSGSHRRNQSELSQPAGGSRTGLQHVRRLGPSSGRVSCGKDSTADRP